MRILLLEVISVWRYPKSKQNRIRNFFPIPNSFDTESDTFFDTKFLRYRIRYFFRYQIFSIPNPKPQKKWKSFETEKFRNWNVTLWGVVVSMMLMQRMMMIHFRRKFSGGGYKLNFQEVDMQQVLARISLVWWILLDSRLVMIMIIMIISKNYHGNHHHYWVRFIDDNKDRKIISMNMFPLIFNMNSSWRIFLSCPTLPYSSSFLSWCLLQRRWW